jgi:HEPN domain-containing protein
MTAGAARKHQASNTSYVYCWCDNDDNVFYVGKGYGSRATSTEGHDHALRYANHFLQGRYDVHIICDQLTDAAAFRIEEALINRFGNALANLMNLCLDKHLPLTVLEARRSRSAARRSQGAARKELQSLLKKHPSGEPRIEALQHFMRALKQEEDEFEIAERTEAAEYQHISLLHRMRLQIAEPRANAVFAEAVSRLASEFARLRRYGEIVALVDEFRSSHPGHFLDCPPQISMSSRDKALVAKREDAARRM